MREALYISSAVLLLSTAVPDIMAQGCCTVGGSSVGGLERGVQQEHTFCVAFGYQTNFLTQAYQGTNRIADPLQRTADVRHVTLQAEYGLMPGLSILGSINYSDKSRELTVTTGSGSSKTGRTASFRGEGVGDVLILAKYSLLQPTIPEPTGIAVGVGASLPTGSFTQEQNGSQLSIDLQPGTGAIALLGWLFVSHVFPETGLQFFLASSYRYAGTNFDGYRLGDEILATLMGEKSVGENYSGFLAVRARFAQKDYANRRFLAGTGGTLYDFMPGIGYHEGGSSFRFFCQFPLYRNVRGIQLTPSSTFGLSFAFEFGSPE